MRRFAIFIAALGWPAFGLASDVDAIHQRYADWADAFNAGETDGACDLFAADLIATDQGQPERDFDAVCAILQDSLTDPSREYRYQIDVAEILVEGDLAVVRADWSLFITPFNVATTERAIDILRREPDGAWRIIRSMSYATE
ncbi:YybH family protein [Bauldia sp.]|uniref:YybH family protein n=1 Tax=Bauldia sp. TaxID=2575872 RepID=UPI003BAC9C37